MTLSATAPAVLVVEDEPLILMEAVEIVEDAGYRAYEAASARQAIEILETHNDILVVFSDVNLSENSDGLELAKTVRDRWPPIKLLITSGRVALQQDDLQGAHFLPKPYLPDQVKTLLRRLTDLAA